MNTHETISDLRDFVSTQATQDAVLTLGERRYQAELVIDVLKSAVRNPAVLEELVDQYSQGVKRNLGAQALEA